MREALRRGIMNRIEAITRDANVFEATRKYDRVVSIEMFEVSVVALLKVTM